MVVESRAGLHGGLTRVLLESRCGPVEHLWGRSWVDGRVHVVDLGVEHPALVYLARCGRPVLVWRSPLNDHTHLLVPDLGPDVSGRGAVTHRLRSLPCPVTVPPGRWGVLRSWTPPTVATRSPAGRWLSCPPGSWRPAGPFTACQHAGHDLVLLSRKEVNYDS